MNKIVVKIKKILMESFQGQTAELDLSGNGQPGPDSVGSEQIQNEGVKKEDLDQDIQDKLDVLDESNVVTEEELEESWREAMHNAGLDIDISE